MNKRIEIIESSTFCLFLVIKYIKMLVISVIAFSKCIIDDIYLQKYTYTCMPLFLRKL